MEPVKVHNMYWTLQIKEHLLYLLWTLQVNFTESVKVQNIYWPSLTFKEHLLY